MRKLVSLIVMFLVSITMLMAQNRTITGVVTSAEDGETVIGASVVVTGTTIGTTTDIDGNFSLSVPQNAQTLTVSYIGLTTQVVKIGKSSKLSIVLSSDEEVLDEVVVTGYGVTKRKAFTGAATTISAAQLAGKGEANAIKSLEGSVPGLQLNMSTGQPGAQANIFIRGRNSLNSGTQPLYVIDGVPVSSDEMGISRGSGVGISPLASLNSNDIETMTILKDATATSIYGARAANGVIVITTKRGSSGKPKANFSMKLGFEQFPKYNKRYEVVNSAKYWEMAEEALLNDYKRNGEESYLGAYGYAGTLDGVHELISDFYGYDKSAGIDTDWLKESTRNGFFQEYSIDVSGGGANENAAKYFTSFDYLSQDGFMRGKDLERYSFRLNLDHKPNKWIGYGASANVAYTQVNAGLGGGYFADPLTQVYMLNPNIPVRDENGDYILDTNTGYNPVALRDEKKGNKNIEKNWHVLGSAYLTLNFTKNLIWKTQVSMDAHLLDEFSYSGFLSEEGAEDNGSSDQSNMMRTLGNITNTLNYLNEFKENHHLNLLLGQESNQTHLKQSYASASNYPVEDLIAQSLTSSYNDASSSQYDLALNSFFANAQYDYANKYYASASFRRDGSSRFGANNRWASFWSVGLKYRLSAENFMKSTENWLQNLTIHASYGTTGNQEVGQNTYSDGEGASLSSWYSAMNLYGFGTNYNGKPGSYHMQAGNKDLKWEETKKFNIGADFTLFNRVDLTVDYYHHVTSDMVFAVPISMTTGLDESYQNLGELTNSGIEMQATVGIIRNGKMQWDVNFNASYNKNEMTKMAASGPIVGSRQIVEVGYPIYEYYLQTWAGVDPQTGDGLFYLNETGDETTTNYNKAAKRYLGSANPKWQGSFGTSFKYAGFDLSMQFNYALGGKIYGNCLRYDEQGGSAFGDTFTNYIYENRWKSPEEPGNGQVPLLTAESNSWNKASSRFLMDGDYLKIKNITLGYNLPKKALKNLYLSNVRLYASAENLYSFCAKNFRGSDPASVGADGIMWWNYPQARSFTFGLTVGF